MEPAAHFAAQAGAQAHHQQRGDQGQAGAEGDERPEGPVAARDGEVDEEFQHQQKQPDAQNHRHDKTCGTFHCFYAPRHNQAENLPPPAPAKPPSPKDKPRKGCFSSYTKYN